MSLVLALALFAPGAAFADGPLDADGEADAYRLARERFAARADEIVDETRAYVDFREQEERSAVRAAFDPRIAELVAKDSAQRTEAIARFTNFLARYPDDDYSDHIRFRLAEFEYEVASEAYADAAEAYDRKVNDPNTPIEELEALGPEPTRDLSKPIALYEQIIARNATRPPSERYEKLDGTYLMLGFVLNDGLAAQYDEARAKATFEELIRVVPESDLADRSHLFLGNFAFANNSFDEALAEYRIVYERGSEGKYYEQGLYQLAWADYKLSRYEEALTLFAELLDHSEKLVADTGRESSYAPDARRFMAFSFADIAFDKDISGDSVAAEHFAKIGPRPYERAVLVQLTDVLERYSRPTEAAEVYTRLQQDPRWTLEPDDPKWQIEVIELYSNSTARDLERAGAERLEFIAAYSEGTPWWEANRNDPEALKVARDFLESSLLEVAIEYMFRAQESGKAEDYSLAAEKYQEYLERFPIADDWFQQQFFLAKALQGAAQYDRALAEFQDLLKNRNLHEFGDGALYSVFELRLDQMQKLGHEPDVPPTDAAVERSYAVSSGSESKQIDVYALSPDRREFVAAADAVMAHTFVKNSNAIDDFDYGAKIDELRPNVLYITGQMMFYHNRYDEARARFLQVIDRFPRSIQASYAAGLLVDSYQNEGNLAKVREYTKIFTANPPGPLQEIDPERFKGTLEGATFKLALANADSIPPEESAQAFLDFRKEFPRSQFGAEALYNAAYYYQRAGRVTQSNELYEQFVAENPNDDRSLGIMLRIAVNYEAAFELDKAIDYYNRVLRHPKALETQKADAQYNKSFLQIGLKRHREAAEGYEAYEKLYANQADREEVYFRAGEQWEEVSSSEAIAFYGRYKQKYPDASPDRYIQADYRLLEIYKKQGDQSRARRQQEEIIADFDRFTRAGKTVGPNGHHYAAAGEYPKLVAAFDELADDTLSGNEDRDDKLLNTDKPAELKIVEGMVDAFVGKYQDFEYNSGALLLKAKTALYYADLGLSLRCPRGMSEEDCWLYEDILDEKVFPQFRQVEEIGVKRLQELVQAAKTQKKHSRFVDDAIAELNRRDPGNNPAVKRELTGSASATMPVELVPRPLPTPDPAPAP